MLLEMGARGLIIEGCVLPDVCILRLDLKAEWDRLGAVSRCGGTRDNEDTIQ